MKSLSLFGSLLVLLLVHPAATATASAAAANRPPNVIFILTDDQGWADARFAGHPYLKTPNLDKFASQSTWIRQFYVAATQDPGESRDVAAEQPELVKTLTAKALAWVETLPPSEARTRAASTGKPQDNGRAQTVPAAAATKPSPDRATIFRQKDSNHDGRLSLDEYLNRFPDQAEGRRRFPTFDTDQDGLLTEEEFVRAGR